MAEKTFHLEIVTPEIILASEDVDSFEATGTYGEFQILTGHTPFLTSLRAGHVLYSVGGQSKYISISGGFCEVKENKAVIIAHTAENASEIDTERAEEAKKRANTRIESKDDPKIDEDRARLALLRALNRLRVADLKSS